jgi:outer membrane receptor protein involved in Fe transport
VPDDSSDFENRIYHPTGDGEEVPLEWSREWSGAGKVTHTLSPDVKLSYNAIFNQIDGQRANNLFRLNPDGLSEQETSSVTHGIDWAQSVSPTTFYEVNLRQIYLKYEDFVYEDLFDERYDEAGPPVGDIGFGDGAFVQGVEFTRFEHKTDSYLAKGSFVSQVTPEHLVKAGGELRMPRVSFGTPGHLRFTTVDGEFGLVRHVDEPPDFPGVKEYRPVIAAGFLQGQMERRDLTLRAGLRVDYFDARTWVPGDPANPANAIAGAPLSVAQETTSKVSVSPRLGVAYPIRDRAAIHFAYGHFSQFPAIGEIFSNADYKVLSQLQAGGTDYGVMGNPDIEPEKTVQYEIGYKQAVTDQFGVDVTTFFKDIRDLLGVEFISTYNDAEYARLTNADFGQVVGVTVALDYREFGYATLSLDYTWQRALGNASDPRETATRAEAGEDPRPRQVAFDWDQRHTLNMTASLSKPQSYSLSAVLQAASGQPYTPVIESGFGHGLEANSGRKPSGVILNLRAERPLPSFGPSVSLFARVFNLLDTRFFNGAVYPSTGSPYYTRFTEADRVALGDPTRFYPPRRIEVGLSLGSEPR